MDDDDDGLLSVDLEALESFAADESSVTASVAAGGVSTTAADLATARKLLSGVENREALVSLFSDDDVLLVLLVVLTPCEELPETSTAEDDDAQED